MPSVLWRGRKGIQPVKNWVVGAGVVICLGQGADLHMMQLMPVPLTVFCSSKSRLVLPFWYRLTRIVPDKGPLNGCSSSIVTTCTSVSCTVFGILPLISQNCKRSRDPDHVLYGVHGPSETANLIPRPTRIQNLMTVASAIPEISRVLKNEIGHTNWPRPFQGWFVVLRPWLNRTCLPNLKSPSYSEDTKGNAKCRNLGDFGSLGVIQGHRQYNHVIEHIRFSIRL